MHHKNMLVSVGHNRPRHP
jgi:hypothetical protein